MIKTCLEILFENPPLKKSYLIYFSFIFVLCDSLWKLYFIWEKSNYVYPSETISDQHILLFSILCNVTLFILKATICLCKKKFELRFNKKSKHYFILVLNIIFLVNFIETTAYLDNFTTKKIDFFDGLIMYYLDIIFLNTIPLKKQRRLLIFIFLFYASLRKNTLKNLMSILFLIIIYISNFKFAHAKTKFSSKKLKILFSFQSISSKLKKINSALDVRATNIESTIYQIIDSIDQSILILDSNEFCYPNIFLAKKLRSNDINYHKAMISLDYIYKVVSKNDGNLGCGQNEFNLQTKDKIIERNSEYDLSDQKPNFKNLLQDLLIDRKKSVFSKDRPAFEIMSSNHVVLFNSKNSIFNFEGEESIGLTIIALSSRPNKAILIFNSPETDTREELKVPSNDENELSIIIENQTKMLAQVSHDMRTPLNCIIGLLQALEDIIPPHLNEEMIQPALSSSKYLANMISDILDINQIKAGRFKLVYSEFDLELLLNEVMSMFTYQQKSKKIETVLVIEKDVPQFLNSDPHRLKQIVINLLSKKIIILIQNILGNAFKYTFNGSITLRCSCYNPDSTTLLKFEVIDTGIGIQEKDKHKLLKAFGKIDDQQNLMFNPYGVGLGLIISDSISSTLANSSEISESEKGLKFSSEFGKGTTFSFIVKNELDDPTIECPENITDLSITDDNAQSILRFKELVEKNNFKRFIQAKTPSSIGLSYSPSPTLDNFFFKRSFEDEYPQIRIHEKKNNSYTSAENKTFLNSSSMNDSKGKSSNSLSFSFMRNISIPEPKLSFGSNSNNTNHNNNNNNLIYPNPNMIHFISDLSISFREGRKKSKTLTRIEDIKFKLESFQKSTVKKCLCPEILIVDDQIFNICALKFLLESFNVFYNTCSSGKEAIHLVKSLAHKVESCCKFYKIIFMDIEMPEKNGLETCLEIRNFLKENFLNETKIVACTGYGDQGHLNILNNYEFDDVLTKPVMKGKLAGLLIKHLGNCE